MSINGIQVYSKSKSIQRGIPVPDIHATYDYSIFKTIMGNRFKRPGHVKQLKKSISENDLTPYRPILVNASMQVIDGQHTMQACEEKGMPIYYIVAPDANGDDVIRLNAFSANWSLIDYLNYYVKLGLKDYQVLDVFMKKNSLTLANAIGALTLNYTGWGEERVAFRTGKFTVTAQEEGQKIVDEILSMRPFLLDKSEQHREFLRAYQIVRERISPEELLSQMKKYNLKISRVLRQRDYMRQFEDIINFRKSKDITRLF